MSQEHIEHILELAEGVALAVLTSQGTLEEKGDLIRARKDAMKRELVLMAMGDDLHYSLDPMEA
jgi:hypothetical protein